MKKLLYFLALFVLICSILILANHTTPSFSNVKSYLASVFFIDSITVSDLHNRYDNGKIKILIVPGHDNQYSGASFGNLREADLAADLGQELAAQFKNDPHFEVTVSRDRVGYSKTFSDYFATHKDDVVAFQKSQRLQMSAFLKEGKIETNVAVDHNVAPTAVGYHLWAINKWANDTKQDLVIHIHFNDHGGRKAGKVGQYSGFTIYTPEFQFSNAKASNAVAEKVKTAIALHYPISNLPPERAGIVPDQELIAIGSNNSLDAAGFLIEYGYIYETGITNPATRSQTLKTFATDTYAGVKNFFESK
jgi:N-acetylmuramoyl-L-alanine amidase